MTLSGDTKAIEELAETLAERNIFHRFLRVNYAFHSPLMDPMREELLKALCGIEPRAVALPMFSTVSGRLVEGTELDGDYWAQNVRKPVLFAAAIDGLLQDGYNVFLELSAHPVLSSAVLECVGRRGVKATVLHSLRREDEERASLLRSLGVLYTLGCRVDWPVVGPSDGRFVSLPNYPWQRARHWNESEEARKSRMGKSHPLLGQRVSGALPTWENDLDLRVQSYLNDHRVQGRAILPGTSYLELAISGQGELDPEGGGCVVEDFELIKACFFSETAATRIQVLINPIQASISINSRQSGADTWTENARGYLRSLPEGCHGRRVDLEATRSRCPIELDSTECYSRLERMGLEYGPTFREIERAWLGAGEGLARIQASGQVEARLDQYAVHPAILDACLQSVLVYVSRTTGRDSLLLPVEIRQLRFLRPLPARCWSYFRIVELSRRNVVADFEILDDSGNAVLTMTGARCQALEEGTHRDGSEELMYEYRWQFQPRPNGSASHCEVFDLPSTDALAGILRAKQLSWESQLGWQEKNRRMEKELTSLCASYIAEGFGELGVPIPKGERFSTKSLAERLSIAPRYRGALERYLEILADAGILRRAGEEWQVDGAPDDARTLWRRLMNLHPRFYAELRIVGFCGERLAGIWRGEIDPGSFTSSASPLALADHLFQDSSFLRSENLLVQDAISAAFRELPAGARLRVLELGAGTGGLTAYALSGLSRVAAEYVVTDASEEILAYAKEKFREFPDLEYRRLDINDRLEAKDFPPHSFDLILASGLSQIASDLRRALDNVKGLLSSEGLLLSIEEMRPMGWVDFVDGLMNLDRTAVDSSLANR